MTTQNTIVWVDIPVIDLDRAIGFYSAVLGAKVAKQEMKEFSFALLPHEQNNVSGCLVPGGGIKPSDQGPLVYLNVHGRLDQALEAARQNGAAVLQPKQAIPPHGFRAIIKDSEGNRVALHSQTE